MMDQMIIERDVSIPTSDGITLKADVFRPKDGKPAPVIMTLGPYGKGVHYKDGYAPQWEWLIKTHPDILPGSTRSLMTWETVDPETWVPWGYVCIRVDSRGAGRSPGYLDIFSPRETRDYYEAIEWAGVQPWSNGKVGLNGISYYAINQWLVASLQPPHLAAMIPWEGAADAYRDWSRHGGILSNVFTEMWYNKQVVSIQHGNPDAIIDPWLNDRASGPPSSLLDKGQLERNRSGPVADALHHPLDDDFYRQRSPDFSKITVPFLSAANWAGFGLHERGNFEAFTQAASKQKWLECHPGRHEEWFYLKEGIDIQKRFLDHFLKGVDNGWDKQPPVLLRLRRPFSDEFEVRNELTWPLTNTKWTPMYFSPSDKFLSWSTPDNESPVSFFALQDGITFTSAPLEHATELTGPLAAKIYASSTTTDMDLFITLQAFAPDGREVEFQGTVDPHTPLAQGWLRASHRKLDPARTLPYRPYHSHDEIQPLEPNQVYELDVEIWPTNILLPAGYRLAIQVGGKDFERTDSSNDGNEAWIPRGSGPWLHTHPEDRPKEIFGGMTSIYGGGSRASYVLLPVIESR